jgi:hypothetical protein
VPARAERVAMTVPQPATADRVALYPLRFGPIYEYRPWGGRKLSGVLADRLPGDGPIGPR